MEKQLRHRLENQVAEAESLRDELSAARQCADAAEANARAAEQRSRDGADEGRKALLGEMETLMEEKLAAEAHARGMENDLGRLRKALASAEERAAEEQGLVIKAAQERIAELEEVRECVRACVPVLLARTGSAKRLVGVSCRSLLWVRVFCFPVGEEDGEASQRESGPEVRYVRR